MKRICNENERNILYRNRNQILQGIYRTASKSRYGRIFVSLFVAIAIVILGIVFMPEVVLDSETVMLIWVGVSLIISGVVVTPIMTFVRGKRETKAFVKKDNLVINGATIVEINPVRGTFSYIEDDFLDQAGNPVIIDYPELPAELRETGIGRRMLVMYDGDSSFQLMKVNEALGGLIPNYSQQYPLMRPVEEHMRIPHPNVFNTNYRGHVLSEGEKENYANEYVDYMQKDAIKVLKICGIVIFVCAMIFSVIIGIQEDCLAKALLIAMGGCAGFAIFIMLIRRFGRYNIRRTAQFTYVQEVIFHSNVIEQMGRTVSVELKVYEWKNNHFELTTYPGAGLSSKTTYGSVIYKFTNDKGKFAFMIKK